jgi:hypothetical protein
VITSTRTGAPNQTDATAASPSNASYGSHVADIVSQPAWRRNSRARVGAPPRPPTPLINHLFRFAVRASASKGQVRGARSGRASSALPRPGTNYCALRGKQAFAAALVALLPVHGGGKPSAIAHCCDSRVCGGRGRRPGFGPHALPRRGFSGIWLAPVKPVPAPTPGRFRAARVRCRAREQAKAPGLLR